LNQEKGIRHDKIQQIKKNLKQDKEKLINENKPLLKNKQMEINVLKEEKEDYKSIYIKEKNLLG